MLGFASLTPTYCASTRSVGPIDCPSCKQRGATQSKPGADRFATQDSKKGTSEDKKNSAGNREGIELVDIGLTTYGLMAPKKMGDFVTGELGISKWVGATRDQVRFARDAGKLGSVFSFLTLALSVNDLRVAIQSHDNLDIATSSVNLGVGLYGLSGPVGAVGASAYGGTSHLLEIPSVHSVLVTPAVDFACRSSGNC